MGHRIVLHEVFNVEVSPESRELLRLLKESPYRLFDKSYMGYLLFLFSDIDKSAQSWLRKHAVALDSLTGSDVGFAVFSARIPINGKVIESERKRLRRRQRPYRNGIETWQVHDLLERGRLELVDLKPGAELFAVNEAVHFIARDLELTLHLPCIVAFDGLPHPDMPWLCIPLQNKYLSQLYRTIQIAVGRLQGLPDIQLYRESILELSTLSKRIESLKSEKLHLSWKLTKKRVALDRLDKEICQSYAAGLKQCREAIERGQQKYFPILMTKLAKQFPSLHLDDPDLSTIPWNLLTRYRKTVFMLERYSAKPWPLPNDALVRLSNIYPNYARTLAKNLPEQITWDSQMQIRLIAKQLTDLWQSQVEIIMAKFPAPSEQMLLQEREQEKQRAALQEEIDSLDTRNQQLSEIIIQTELRVVETSRRILDFSNRPSFCKLLQEACSQIGINPVPAASYIADRYRTTFWTSWLPINSLLKWITDRTFWKLPKSAPIVEGRVEVPYWERPPTAFASYARINSKEVAYLIQGMRAWQPGLDIFLDFHSLFPGELWKDRLEEEILKRDRFLLFWSRAASKSEYVDSEWRTALKYKGLSFITPVPLEPPDIAPPPTELAALHFNDLFLEMRRFAQTSELGRTY